MTRSTLDPQAIIQNVYDETNNALRVSGGFWSGDATRVDTTSTIARVNSGGATAAQVDVGVVGPASQPGVKFGGDTSWYRRSAGFVQTDNTVVTGGANSCIYVSIGDARQTRISSVGPSSSYAGIAFGPAESDLWYLPAVGTIQTNSLVKLGAATSRIVFGNAAQEQTTVGAAGGATALPLTPTKYFKVIDSGGTELVIPAYAAA